MKSASILLALFFLGLLTSCSTVTTRQVITLDRYQHIFVQRPGNENHRLDEIIVAELRQMGRDASSGPMTMMPDNTQAVLSYDSRWTWDFKTYLIELNMELHTVHPRKKLADGNYHQPSITTAAPAEVIQELLDRLFKTKAKAS